MASFYLILALLIQCSLSYADVSVKNGTESIEASSSEILNSAKGNETVIEKKSVENVTIVNEESIKKPESDDVLIKDFKTATTDWVDTILGSNLYPSSAASMMAQAANSNKSAEEQLEEIKEVASEITMAIQSEMANLLTYALNFVDKDVEGNNLRKKRSAESPMDSSQLVMRLLNHIKSNNEYQNIAIEKMMSAQEIADKYGVEFNPDPEILSDFAFAANQQAQELTSILQEVCDPKNSTCQINETDEDTETDQVENTVSKDNTTLVFPEKFDETQANLNSTPQSHEHILTAPVHVHHTDNHVGYNYYSYPPETQIPSPAQYSYGSSANPNFYDFISYNPNEYLPYCSVDSYPFISFDEPEPELVAEEYEETVSSRVIIEQDDEPGSSTVNHIMTYTVSEKAHFRSPQIEQLPQQMQYYFLLM